MKPSNQSNKYLQRTLSLLTIVIGLLLMTFMVIVEDEPGGIPLLLVLVGTGWYFRLRTKKLSKSI